MVDVPGPTAVTSPGSVSLTFATSASSTVQATSLVISFVDASV
jgi:hypothetical protein